jgi:hypothetical protein
MSSNFIRFSIRVAFLLIFVSLILVVRAHFGGPNAADGAATAAEQASVLEIASAAHPSQQGAEHFLPPASLAFEPLLLLLLGSILLSIGTGIKLLLTRKLRQR